jgi:hypothetical protein
LGGEDQDPFATSRFIKFESKKSSAFVLVDLTGAYKKFAQKVTRGVAMVHSRQHGRRAVVVQDEFELEKPCELVWPMTTDAKISIRKDRHASLTLKGKELTARILTPVNARFTVESAEQKPPQKTNKGVSRLVVRLPKAEGNVRVAILLSPRWKDGYVSSVQWRPLAEW